MPKSERRARSSLQIRMHNQLYVRNLYVAVESMLVWLLQHHNRCGCVGRVKV